MSELEAYDMKSLMLFAGADENILIQLNLVSGWLVDL